MVNEDERGTELLKPDCCRAPPRSSHRAAGARHHQRLARARVGSDKGERGVEMSNVDGGLRPVWILPKAAPAVPYKRVRSKA